MFGRKILAANNPKLATVIKILITLMSAFRQISGEELYTVIPQRCWYQARSLRYRLL